MATVATANRPANDEIISGYLDGHDLNNPEPSDNRSHSYRHGFAVARHEKLHNEPLDCADALREKADAAMDRDCQ